MTTKRQPSNAGTAMPKDFTQHDDAERSHPSDAEARARASCGAKKIPTRSSAANRNNSDWVFRWKYEVSEKPVRKGIWALKGGGYFLRTRVVDPKTGRIMDYQRAMRGATLSEAESERRRLQSDVRDLVTGRKRTPTGGSRS